MGTRVREDFPSFVGIDNEGATKNKVTVIATTPTPVAIAAIELIFTGNDPICDRF